MNSLPNVSPAETRRTLQKISEKFPILGWLPDSGLGAALQLISNQLFNITILLVIIASLLLAILVFK